MKTIAMKAYFIIGLFLCNYYLLWAQCANEANIFSFEFNDVPYQVVKENKTWAEAAACAVERGGFLAEIVSQAQQDAIFTQIDQNAGINPANTVAPDGGGGSYVWLGGNDIATEGEWIWDGDNDGKAIQFWQGDTAGNPVGGLYNNWGIEPDNFNNQDALAISLNGWPLGDAGQWNDVDDSNSLYYLIEFSPLSVGENQDQNSVRVYPTKVNKILTIEVKNQLINSVAIINMVGQTVKTFTSFSQSQSQHQIALAEIKRGVYFVEVSLQNGTRVVKKIIK